MLFYIFRSIVKRFGNFGYLQKNKPFWETFPKKGFADSLSYESLKMKSANSYKNLNLPIIIRESPVLTAKRLF